MTLASLLGVYASVNGTGAGWASGQTLGLLGAAALLLALFLGIEARARSPLMRSVFPPRAPARSPATPVSRRESPAPRS